MNAELPVRVYTPESPVRHPGKFVREMLRDLLACRELAWRLFVRDFSAAYRQSYLGYFWMFVPPLIAALPWIFLSSQKILSGGDTGDVPYPLFVLAGTTLWTVFIEAINCPINALNSGRSMMSKINFPREALIVSQLGQILLNLSIRTVMLLGLMLFVFKVPIGPHLALAPLGLIGVLITGLAIGFWVAPVGMLYGDVSRAINIGSIFWMILTPVVYVPKSEGLIGWLSTWNPASPLITTARSWLIGQPHEQILPFLLVIGSGAIFAFLGWALLRLTLPMIVERMGG